MSNYGNRINNVTNILAQDTNIINNLPNYLNTFDATATSSDICAPRTAYVNGQKIEGLIFTLTDTSTENMEALQILPEYGNPETMQMDCIGFRAKPATKHHLPMCWKDNSNMDIYCTHSNLATAINLTPEILKSGENVLGVVGNYSGGGSTENLENVISEQENIIANLSNLVNTKAGTLFMVPDGMKFAQSTISTFPELDTSNVTDMTGMFHNCKNLISIPNFDTSNVINMPNMFQNCYNLTTVPNYNMSNVTTTVSMFQGCNHLVSVPNFNTSNVVCMTNMFNGCTNLTSVSNFDTSNVTHINMMFVGCNHLVSVPNFNTSKVTEMRTMFMNCSNLVDVPNFDTSNITSGSYIFANCNSLISAPEFNTPKVTDMRNMFMNCSNLVNMPQYNTSNTTYMSNMFARCNNLSDVSIQNIINMCLNSNITTASYKNLSNANANSPFYQTNITNSRYSNRLTELTSAGWTY